LRDLSIKSQVRPLSTPLSLMRVSADDKRLAYTEEEMGISVTGSVVISDKPESLEKSKGP
jgi:hypothetical protein